MTWARDLRNAFILLGTACRRGRAAATIDALRSALHHDAGRKLQILAGRLSQAGDRPLAPPETEMLLRLLSDLRRVYRAHAAYFAASLRTLWAAARILSALQELERAVRAAAVGDGRAAAGAREVADALRIRSAEVADRVVFPAARRLTELARRAADEIRTEIPAPVAGPPIRLEFSLDDPAAECWVPSRDAERWTDLLRNLLRNAVHATEERLAAGTSIDPLVRLTLRARTEGETCCEVADRGVGMSPELVERIWTDGQSTRGTGRGQGLTEEKRRFILDRGTLEVRSQPGAGTVFSLGIAKRTIPVRPARWWRTEAFAVAGLIAALGLIAAGFALRSTGPLASIGIAGPNSAQGLDDQGRILWERNLHERIQPNDRGPLRDPGPLAEEAILRDGRDRATAVVLATTPEDGPGTIWYLKADGRPYRRQPLRWAAPQEGGLGRLICWWRAPVPWDAGATDAVMLHVRDNRYAPSATLFFSANGDSLGAYYHPGHMVCRTATDLDEDGRTEVLLVGINNAAAEETSFLRIRPRVYIDCLAVLEVPRVGGQAWPYRAWSDLPQAREEGYVLLPPLAPDIRPDVQEVTVGAGHAAGTTRIEAVLGDGRIYAFEPDLRPIACFTGDHTRARELLPQQPMGPLLWIHDGATESVDVPVEGATR